MYRKIIKAFNLSTNEEIMFSDGELEVINDGDRKSWRAQLADVQNGKSLNEAMNSSAIQLMTFVSEEKEEFQGNVIIRNISSSKLGVYIELTGDGKLEGY